MAPESEEMKETEASPPPPTINKFDAILFDSDQGPASSLFMEGGMSTGSSPETSRSPINKAPVAKSPPRAGMVDATVVINEEEEKEKISVLEKLREQLYKTQADLATEKSSRKRKEKSLIKLAKELNNRSADGGSKDSKILEMTETIEDLEVRLAERNRVTILELPKLKAKCARLEADLAVHENSEKQLRHQLKEASSEVTKVKSELEAALSEQVSQKEVVTYASELKIVPETRTRSSARGATAIALGFVAMYAVAVGIVVQKDVVSMDDVCAPVLPGSKFFATDNAIFEAPWWAPDTVKEQTFSILCGGRVRTRLEIDNGSVEISSTAGESLWQRRNVGGLTVDSDKMTVRNKWGYVEEVPAPWSSA